MAKSRELGMRTFDWALFDLYNEGIIGYEEAIRNADSANELRLNIKLKSKRGEPAQAAGLTLSLKRSTRPRKRKWRKSARGAGQAGGAQRELEDGQLAKLREEKRRADEAARQ